MSYLAKSPRPDINNGPGVTRIVPTFWPPAFLQIQLEYWPLPGHSNLGSDARYTCSSLPLIVCWVLYLNKAPRYDLNNGLKITSIVVAVWTPGVYSKPTCIMAPPQAILTLCQMEYTSVQVSYLWFPGRCHIRPKAAGLTSIMA